MEVPIISKYRQHVWKPTKLKILARDQHIFSQKKNRFIRIIIDYLFFILLKILNRHETNQKVMTPRKKMCIIILYRIVWNIFFLNYLNTTCNNLKHNILIVYSKRNKTIYLR